MDAAALPARIVAVPARVALGGIVAVGFAARWLLASLHVPHYFPDEYIYSSLARGIAETGLPQIRGEVARFPALLEPLLAAPFWLAADTETAFRLTQGLHALAVSLAAVPAYLLARHLGLGARIALLLAALAVAWPAAGFASYALADPIAYPLVLTALYAAVRVLELPSARGQLIVLAVSGLAAFARVQFVVLPVVFLGAALVVERGRLGRFKTTLACLAAPLLPVLAVGPSRALGYYENVLRLDVDPAGIARWAATDAMILAYAAGWLIVPGALAGLALARGRAERAFAVLTALLAACLIGQSAWYESNSPAHLVRVHERYFFVLLPLLATWFALYARRGRPRWPAIAALAAAMVAVSAAVPLSGYTVAQGTSDSPTLQALIHLESLLAVADASLAVAAGAALLSAASVAVALAPRRLAPVALTAALGTCALIGAGAYAYERQAARTFERSSQGDPDWVDDTGLGSVALLQLRGAERLRSFEQLFWNRSLDTLLTVDERGIDSFTSRAVRLAGDGTLLDRGRPLRQPLLVNEWGSRAVFATGEQVAERAFLRLVRSDEPYRLRMLASGLAQDGWLAGRGGVRVWTDRPGKLRLELSLPAGAKPVSLELRGPAYERVVELRGGGRSAVVVPVTPGRPWRLAYSTPRGGWYVGGRFVSVLAETPVFTPNR